MSKASSRVPAILERLKGVRRNRKGWVALCPAHADKNPSLSIDAGDGKVLLHCHAGCATKDILAAVGLKMSGLFSDGGSAPRTVATYDYADERGALLFQVVRYEPKSFRQRRPDGKGGWIWNLKRVRRVIYRLPEVIPAQSVLIVEGEKDVETARGLGLVATCNPGGASKWREEYSETLRGKRVAIMADTDEPGEKHAEGVAASLAGKAEMLKLLELPGAKDLSEWVEHGGTHEALLGLIRNAPEWKPATAATEPARVVNAPLGAGEACAMLADVLFELVGFFRSYLAISPAQADVLGPWTFHTHTFDAFERTPYLNIFSPEKRSGKTLVLELLSLVVRNSWFTSSATTAALARKIADGKPTVLLDEADTMLAGNGERSETLRGILNAGYARGGKFTRCVGEGSRQIPTDFEVFAPKAIAGLRELPDTIADRSIPIRMKRALPGEIQRRFYRREVEPVAAAIRARLESCAGALAEQLKAARPERMSELNDRQCDIVEPLLAIADIAGEGWVARLRAALRELSAPAEEAQHSVGVQLLTDLRGIFPGRERLATSDILRALCELDESPWKTFSHGQPLTGHALGRTLRHFRIHSQKWREGEKTTRGYRAADFEDAWARYCPLRFPQKGVELPQAPQPMISTS